MNKEGLIYNLDALGIIILTAVLIIGVGMYFGAQKGSAAKKKTEIPSAPQEDRFETAEELFPSPFPRVSIHEDVPELPQRYRDDRLTIMARDPETLFAYWDISDEKACALREVHGQKWDESQTVLRIYDITDLDDSPERARLHVDVPVEDRAGNWYLKSGIPGRTYYAELGRLLNDGQFVAIAVSNLTRTPRRGISDKIDPDWMLVSDLEKRLFGRIALEGHSSIDLIEKLH